MLTLSISAFSLSLVPALMGVWNLFLVRLNLSRLVGGRTWRGPSGYREGSRER